jgi:hypothetical protein
VVFAEKPSSLPRQNAVEIGYVMMKTSMFSSPMPEIVATEIIDDLLSVGTIIQRDIQETGKTVQNAGRT